MECLAVSKRWIVDRATLKEARQDDLQYVDDPDHLDFLAIYFGNGEWTSSKCLAVKFGEQKYS